MLTKEIIDTCEENILHTYNRYQIALDRGDGVYLYDNDGKKYLDFFSGIAVFALGYGNKKYNDALKSQIDKLMHTSNYFYNEPSAVAAAMVREISGMDKIFFTNSGAEANEGAYKTAKKYAYLKDGSTDHEVIAFEHSFHGRTLGALSLTGKKAYREAFESFGTKVNFADYNDIDSVKALVNDKTCAIILEPVQGEGGVYPATEQFLKDLRALCDEKDILLIFDEVQCGMGRTGYWFAHQKFGIKPDVMTTAKALGCGFPVGAFMMNEKVAKASLVAGDHGTTYGGNPMAGCAVKTVIEIYKEDNVLQNVKDVAPYLEKKLDELADSNSDIIERRGSGLMQGLEFNRPVGDIIKKAMDNGLMLINAGPNVIRFLPPLVISKENVDEMIEILKKSIN